MAFCRHLIDREPDAQILARYTASHESRPDLFAASSPFELVLLRFARRGPVRTRLADAYSSSLAPGSVVRRKLALLAAILECTGSTFEAYETPTVRSTAHWWVALAWKGVSFVAALAGGALILGPRHLVMGSTRGSLSSDSAPDAE